MLCSIFAHYWYYLYSGILQTLGIFVIYALKHIVFGILVKKYFVTLKQIHKNTLIGKQYIKLSY